MLEINQSSFFIRISNKSGFSLILSKIEQKVRLSLKINLLPFSRTIFTNSGSSLVSFTIVEIKSLVKYFFDNHSKNFSLFLVFFIFLNFLSFFLLFLSDFDKCQNISFVFSSLKFPVIRMFLLI